MKIWAWTSREELAAAIRRANIRRTIICPDFLARLARNASAPIRARRIMVDLGPDQRDFPALADFYNAGGTDYLCLGFRFGESADPLHGTAVLYSFTTNRSGGFYDAEIELLHSTLPELSLAMKAYAGYDIASGFLRTYLGNDAGARVHSGAVERGTVNGLHSVLWYVELRGFTRISDVTSRRSSRC